MSDINYDELLGGTTPAPVTASLGGAFEGASRLNHDIALWMPSTRSADGDALPAKATLDARSRDMVRNDAYVQGASAIHKDSIVGAQYLLNARPATRVIWGKQDDVWEEEFQEEVEEIWELYFDSEDAWVDAERKGTGTDLVRREVAAMLSVGEFVAVAEYIRDDGAPFSTAIQIVDPDRLSDPQDRVLPWATLPNQRAGIRFNERGAPQSYFIRSEHPNDYGPTSFKLPTWKEIPTRTKWGRKQVIHLFDQVRPDQSRGVTELAAALSMMKKTHVWRDITIQHAAAQGSILAAIQSELPMGDIAARISGDSPEAYAKAIEAVSAGYLSNVAQFTGEKGGMALDGVRIPRLFPGEKLEFKTPASGPLGTDFESSMLRYIAAAAGISYEQLSRDYTNTNYSSARAAMLETWKFMQSRKKLIADRFANIMFRLWLEEAVAKNALSTFPASKRSMLYTGGRLNLKFDALSRCDWVGASRGQIDEYKETQAAVLRITNGLSTAEDELARLGKDWRKVYRQLKREADMRATMGLVITPSEIASQNAEMAAQDQQTASNDQRGNN